MIQMNRKKERKLSKQLPDRPAYRSLVCITIQPQSCTLPSYPPPPPPHFLPFSLYLFSPSPSLFSYRSFFIFFILLPEAAFSNVNERLYKTHTSKHYQPYGYVLATRTVMKIDRACGRSWVHIVEWVKGVAYQLLSLRLGGLLVLPCILHKQLQ